MRNSSKQIIVYNDMELTEQQSEEIKFVFCKHYKKLTVEDFAFNENRERLHYGKCAVIGYCIFDRGVYFLGNIRITSLNGNLQMPDNATKVLLLTNLCKEEPPVDKFVEVFGESVLYDKTIEYSDDVSSIPCTTSLDVYRTRTVSEEVNGALDVDYYSIVNSSYVPAIKVHEIIPINSAHEIVNCNLRLQLIMDRT